MAERVAHAVGGTEARRRAGIGGLLGVALVALAVLIGSGVFASAPSAHAVSKANPNSSQAISYKVNRLISEMSVQEKFGQLTQAGPDGPNGTASPQEMQEVREGKIGSILDMVGVKNINALQQAALQSPHHIPLIFALDVIHGYKTMYPISLGESSSWDPALTTADASMAASEATADGLKWTFSPMVDVTRDPRWGRVQGTSGEDPFLGASLAAARVHGYQGSNIGNLNNMAATVKHFAAYGAPVAGREYNTVDMSTQQLYNDYLPTYKAAINAGAATVMSSFNSLNGVPNTANPYTLQTILRQQWGFTGPVISDYQAVEQLEGNAPADAPAGSSAGFGYARDGADAARLALTSGVDIEMAVQVPSFNSTYDNYGPRLLAEHKITMTQLNNAVRRVLTLKFMAGEFSHPYTDPKRVNTAELTPKNIQQAKTAADQSQVLLENHNNALPLNAASTKSIAVVGPLADDAMDQLGADVPIGYDSTPADLKTTDHITTVLDGIKQDDPGAQVTYAQGCDISTGCTDDSGFPAAVAAANAAQVTVVVLGEPASDSGEASSRTDIGLPGDELKLLQEIAATGKPYVVDLMNGRPLTLQWLHDNAPAVLESWYPGTAGGKSVADILFGNVNPSGKLPMSFPVNTGQIPISYNELPTGRPYSATNKYTSKYLDAPNTPLYPFGYGLSYSTFTFSNLHISRSSVGSNGPETVTATISNTGKTAGTDVAQLYLHENYTSILQPVRKLEGFMRVTLNPGQSKTVTFKLNGQNLGFYDNAGQFNVQPGPFDVWVGDSSNASTTPELHGTFNVN